jgi:hypothetical protein|tara:strand:- start:599 stop:832 length:234 start_codon:yes stop_codon:yes gene_type:complete
LLRNGDVIFHTPLSLKSSGVKQLNALEIEETVSELALLPFDAEEFAYALLVAFGNKAITILGWKVYSSVAIKRTLGL